MNGKPCSDEDLQYAVNIVAECGTPGAAHKKYGIHERTLRDRMTAAKLRGIKPTVEDSNDINNLKSQLKRLRAEMATEQKKALDHMQVRRRIIQLAADVENIEPPKWTVAAPEDSASPGAPTLFLSDLHWGEVVHPGQINGVNRFNVEIAHRRLRFVVERAIHLCKIISPKMDFPGIIVPLGGDMISGNIHDELTATNELNSMPAVLDLFGELIAAISVLAQTFGNVFLPCVTGNHGRDTMKIWGKDRHHTSFDWLLYCFLAKHFENDKRISFLIPDGPDAYYRVYRHRYLLSHGDQFRGGDGMIGALGPLLRGDHKKRSRNAQIDMEYDTMICGHWHQDIFLRRLVVNSSLKGYDEYAFANNFPFEVPSQQLWVTHPKNGVTFRMPVFADEQKAPVKSSWVSVSS